MPYFRTMRYNKLNFLRIKVFVEFIDINDYKFALKLIKMVKITRYLVCSKPIDICVKAFCTLNCIDVQVTAYHGNFFQVYSRMEILSR